MDPELGIVLAGLKLPTSVDTTSLSESLNAEDRFIVEESMGLIKGFTEALLTGADKGLLAATDTPSYEESAETYEEGSPTYYQGRELRFSFDGNKYIYHGYATVKLASAASFIISEGRLSFHRVRYWPNGNIQTHEGVFLTVTLSLGVKAQIFYGYSKYPDADNPKEEIATSYLCETGLGKKEQKAITRTREMLNEFQHEP